jgi:hypothetical protein
VAYDPRKRHGWARGLIHFHTEFSDGWASVLRAAEIAVQAGFDFLVVTDHLRNLKLFTHRTLQQYMDVCDDATRRVSIPVIPGGEMEIHWNDPATTDFSEAHTLALCIRPLVSAGEFDWTTPDADPFAHWPDSQRPGRHHPRPAGEAGPVWSPGPREPPVPAQPPEHEARGAF